VIELVVLDDLLRLLGDLRVLDGDDCLRARLGGEHRQDARAAADVENDFIFEQVLVLVD